jgi:hypothetical protein
VRPAAQDAWEIVTAPLRDGGITLVALGLLVLLAAWLGGTSPRAVQARATLAPYLARPALAYGVAAALFLLLLWWAPVVQLTRGPLILAAAALLAVGIELLRRQVAREGEAPPTDGVAGAAAP